MILKCVPIHIDLPLEIEYMYEPSYLNISCNEDKLQENTFATGYFHLSTNLHLFAISCSVLTQLMCYAYRDALDLQILGIDVRIGFLILVAGAEDIPSVLFDQLFQIVLALI